MLQARLRHASRWRWNHSQARKGSCSLEHARNGGQRNTSCQSSPKVAWLETAETQGKLVSVSDLENMKLDAIVLLVSGCLEALHRPNTSHLFGLEGQKVPNPHRLLTSCHLRHVSLG